MNKNIAGSYPQKLRANMKPDSPVYKFVPDYYAVHDPEGKPAVNRGTPNQEEDAAGLHQIGPVYALQPGGSHAVPTGLVFLRLKDGVSVDERLEDVKRAGYEVTEKVSYAPNAAWLRARSGNVADALSGIDALEKLPDVENVEPQMLMENVRR